MFTKVKTYVTNPIFSNLEPDYSFDHLIQTALPDHSFLTHTPNLQWNLKKLPQRENLETHGIRLNSQAYRPAVMKISPWVL